MGGVSSPFAEEASEPAVEAFLEAVLEASVFFGAAARFASRAAFEADTMVRIAWCSSAAGNKDLGQLFSHKGLLVGVLAGGVSRGRQQGM